MPQEKIKINPDTTIKELISRYPIAGKVFIDQGLLCFGCPTEDFHTLADVSALYNLDLDGFISQLISVIESSN